MMRYLYSALLYLLLPLLLLRLYWRGRRDVGHRQRWRERLGVFPALPINNCLWIHAVSVGEVRAALPLIRALLQRFPHSTMLVTTTTLTGSRQVQEALGTQVQHLYAPYDVPGAVRRFLDHAKPRLAIIMETELWPNLLHHCAARNLPVVLANARLSAASARGYARVAPVTRRMLHHITLIAAQTAADAQRFRELGATRVQVLGNLKYDMTLPATVWEQGQTLRRAYLGMQRQVWIAASTHNGEDEQMLAALALLRERWPELLLLLVPRHPERFVNVARLCAQRGFSVVKRSSGERCNAQTAVFLGDSMGELLTFYAASDLAFIGGSLVRHGGQNMLEAAALGVPALFGPYIFNFTEVSARLLEAQAAAVVADSKQLAAAVEHWLANPTLRMNVGRRGRTVVEQHRGAVAALVSCIAALECVT